MTRRTTKIVPPFDFAEAEALPLAQRFARCLARARVLVTANGYQAISDFPCIPAGANDVELTEFESRKVGAPLPDEYRKFVPSVAT